MLAPQRASPIYQIGLYGNPMQGTVAFRSAPLDVNWFDTWPVIRSILLGSIMLISSAAVIGLEIANLVIEGNKSQYGTSELGGNTAKVGAGLWSGSISFLAAILILVTIFVRNKRIAATFALIAVTLAFFFTIVLIGLTANAIQIYQNPAFNTGLESTQYNLIIAILSIAAFILTQCIIFFIIYVSVFFSSSTRRSTTF